MIPKIRVLIIDDSAFARKVIREVLSRESGIEVVGIARDGIEGLEKIAELKPDVVTLDLLMPDLDGLGFLRAMPKENAPRVIVVSASGAETDIAIEALELGAVDLVTKPTPLPTDRLYDLSNDLVYKVKAAAIAKISPFGGPAEKIAKQPKPVTEAATTQLVVVGTSTGGPQALTHLFKNLPADLPVPLAVALHIPAGYTAPLAARLSKISAVPVIEAANGMKLRAGEAVIAPGGMHLSIRAEGSHLYAVVSREPASSIHHPSVDVLFESAAIACGAGTLGLIMTGMGNDGTAGSRKIREAGGRVIAESASSCIVFGMPRSVIEAGAASFEAPLQNLSTLLVDQIFR